MGDRFYFAADIGRTGKGGGFAAWEWTAGGILRAYGPTELEKFVSRIITEAESARDVVLVLEAPLWGTSSGNVRLPAAKPDWCHWSARFSLEIDGCKYREREWFTNAGGAAGLIAQMVLTEIERKLSGGQASHRGPIHLIESYISGLRRTKGSSAPSDLKKPMPDVPRKLGHYLDALEGLLMSARSLDAVSAATVLSSRIESVEKLDSTIATYRTYCEIERNPVPRRVVPEGRPFPLGVVRSDHFKFKPDEMVFTWRSFSGSQNQGKRAA